jgi:hypothetical protein
MRCHETNGSINFAANRLTDPLRRNFSHEKFRMSHPEAEVREGSDSTIGGEGTPTAGHDFDLIGERRSSFSSKATVLFTLRLESMASHTSTKSLPARADGRI